MFQTDICFISFPELAANIREDVECETAVINNSAHCGEEVSKNVEVADEFKSNLVGDSENCRQIL